MGRLLDGGHEVVVVDNFDPFYDVQIKLDNLRPHRRRRGFSFVEADIRVWSEIHAAVRPGIDGIVHLAAKAGVRPSIQDPAGYGDSNVVGTAHVLEAARRFEIGQIVFASSSSVYGVNPGVPWSESTEPLLPISPYAMTKLLGERLGSAASAMHGLEFTACRIFTVYGSRQRPDLAITKFARRILRGEPIQVYGSGESMRDYTHVDDIVEGFVLALHRRSPGFRVFNLASGRPVALMDMIRTLEKVLDRKASIDHVEEQEGDVPRTWADIEMARSSLGFEPRVELLEGLEESLTWFREMAASEAGP